MSPPSTHFKHPSLLQPHKCLFISLIVCSYKELGLKIKQLLTCGRKQAPTAKVVMRFDDLLFVGGLKAAGTPSTTKHGYTRYKINNYSDLDTLLENTGTSEV